MNGQRRRFERDNTMVRTFLITGLGAAALASAAFAPAVAAQIEIEAEGPVIELSIYESITAAPDIATIGAGVSTEAPTAVEAMRANAREMNTVIDRIKSLGIAAEDIQTSGISLNARYDYDRDTREQIFRGYQVANRVSVILRDVDAVGGILDALVAAGATDLDGPRFAIEDDEAAKDKARSRAIERGMKRARAYAALVGGEDVRVLEINEAIEGQGRYEGAQQRAMAADTITVTASKVEPGLVSTGVSIGMKFEVVSTDDTKTAQPE